MRAVTAPEPGGPDALVVSEHPDPKPGPGEVVIDVVASAVNRADTLQRQGFYPPPEGASDVLGLECSGRISEVGAGVEGYAVGDEVCALLAAGGYAEKVAVPAGQVMPVPAASTSWPRRPSPRWPAPSGPTCSWSPASSPTRPCWSTAARAASATSRSSSPRRWARGCSPPPAPPRSARSASRSAPTARSTTTTRTSSRCVKEEGGADVILDNMGAKYLDRNVSALATEGRLVVIGMQGGTKAELDLGSCCPSAAPSSRPRCAPARPRRRRPSAPPSSSTSGRWSARAGCVRRAREGPAGRRRPGPRADGVRLHTRQDPARGRVSWRWVGSSPCRRPANDRTPDGPGHGDRSRRSARRRARRLGRRRGGTASATSPTSSSSPPR